MTSKPPFPCIVNPKPQSVFQPGIQVRKEMFSVQGVPTEYPYETRGSDGTVTGGTHIHHLVFDGQGPPPNDIGDPGDIYFDYVHSDIVNFQTLVLYARMEHCWKRWPGKDLHNLLQHPHLPNYFLWQKGKTFGWTYATNIVGGASVAAESAKREKAGTAAKMDWEEFRVEVAADERTSRKRNRGGEDADMNSRKKTKTSETTASFSELMEAAMHDADAICTENERLKAEVDRLKGVTMVQRNTIQLAQGLAGENADLQTACQILVEENSKLKDEVQILQAKLQNHETEVTRLREKHQGIKEPTHGCGEQFPMSPFLAEPNFLSPFGPSNTSGPNASKSRSRSATLPALSNSDSEKETLPTDAMAAQITVKEELQELSQESLPSKLPSLPAKSGTSTKATGTLDAPIDLTMDDIDDLEPRAAPEAPPISLASLDQSALLERTSSLDEPAHGGNSDGLRTDIDPIKPQREGAATMAIAGPSSSPEPAADDSADRDADNVKVESADDICLRSQSPISSENGLTLDHLDVIFHTESSVMFCRLCVIRQDKTPSPDIRAPFPVNTPRRRLFDHCESDHPAESRKFAFMTPEKLAKIRAHIPDGR